MMASGVPEIILANQNRPAPKGEYASLQIRTDIGQRGQGIIKKKELPGDAVQTEIYPQLVIHCILEFYRGKAHEYAQNMAQVNRRPDVVWELFKNKISIRNTSPVFDLTALQSSNYEQRSRVEIYLWAQGKSTVTVNNILKVDVAIEDYKFNTYAPDYFSSAYTVERDIIQTDSVNLRG